MSYERSNKRSSKWLILALLGLFFSGWLLRPSVTRTPAQPSQENPLQQAWEQARIVGVYDFSAEAQQTLRPRPDPGMIGLTSQHVNMSVDGEAVSSNETRLSVSVVGAGFDSTPVAVVQEGNKTYLLKNGERMPVENPLGAVAPTNDYTSYLVVAEHVQPCPSETLLPGAVACYTYDINGRRFAEHTRDQMQAQLESEIAALAPDARIQLDPSPELMKMTGSGKVWLDADNLPLRMVVNMTMPEASPFYDSKTRMVVDFDFDENAIRAAAEDKSAPFIGRLKVTEFDLFGFFSFFIALIPASLLVAYRRRSWLYGLIAVSISVVMLLTPLLQSAALVRLFDRQVHAASAVETLTEVLGLSEASEAATVETSAPQAVQTYEPTAYCGKGGDINADTDSDGLADDAEYCLGTNPNVADSDYDGLSDGVEVTGFEYGKTITTTWYSDPLKPDSNADGINDNNEWKSENGGLSTASWDTDDDGTPNVWDFDDDDDGVADSRDYSPASRTKFITSTTNATETFKFDITGQYDGYVYIDMQVQPLNKDHLRYSVTPLDWRNKDEHGQITQLNGSTEDVHLVPMLEVETNIPPNQDLAEQYNTSVFTDVLDLGFQRMTIPLNVVGDGSSVEAFGFRLAYSPAELGDLGQTGIRWRNMRIIWIARAKLDQQVGEEVVEKNTPIHTYTEPSFRITGWQVVKSGKYRSAILGTPDFPDDDRQLFQLLFGLSSSFLLHQEPDLDEINARFSGVNTPIEERWQQFQL